MCILWEILPNNFYTPSKYSMIVNQKVFGRTQYETIETASVKNGYTSVTEP